MNKKCDICGSEVNFQGGGAALMMAFCYNHSTTLSNMAYCSECYKMFVEEPLKQLSNRACLNIAFEEVSDGSPKN